MTLFSALNAGVSGIQSNGSEISMRADNIANVNSIASKRFEPIRRSLVNPPEGGYSAGGVQLDKLATLDVQGTVEASSIPTHMAIQGNGLFIVSEGGDDGSAGGFSPQFTRDGSFTIDKEGFLCNNSGKCLMAYKKTGNTSLDKTKLSSGTVDNLRAVNVNDIGSTPTKTSSVEIAANLKANQDILEGSGSDVSFPTNAIFNRNLQNDSIIYPELGVERNDMLSITFGQNAQKVDFTYGGFASGSKVSNDALILGSTTTSQRFSKLVDGDVITLSSSSTTIPVEFSFKEEAPDKTKNQFNSLETLADAITYNSLFSARVTDGKLVVSPADANDSMTFANGADSALPANSKNLSTTSIFGHGNAISSLSSSDITANGGFLGTTSPANTFGLTNGDSFKISVGNGTGDETFTLTFKNAAPVAAKGEFSSLNDLATAIQSVSGGKLTSSVTANILSINAAAGNSILECRDTDTASIVAPMGIRLHNTFSVADGATIGDGMSIEIGSFTSSESEKLAFANNSVFGRYDGTITGSKGVSGTTPILGATTPAAVFSTATIGDGINIVTGGNNVTFNYGAANDFTTLTGLQNEINGHAGLSTEMTATVTADGKLQLVMQANQYLKSISSTGVGGSDFAEELGINLHEPSANDSLTITLDSGESEKFLFTSVMGGSDAGGAPKTSFGEFNNLTTLKQAIEDRLSGKVAVTNTADDMTIATQGSYRIYSIEDNTGTIAESLGIDLESTAFELSFTGNTQGSAAGGNPDYTQGEFNNTVSLSQAINSMSKEKLSMNFSADGNSFSFQVANGGKLKYINDEDEDGDSSFATTLGIRGVDLISSLGVSNTASGTRRFNSMDNLQSLVNDEVGISAKYYNGKLRIFNDDPTSAITFSSGNADFMQFMDLPTTQLDEKYNPLVQSSNIASGNITPHFSRSIKVVDSLGSTHNITVGYVKIASNKWNFEVFANDPSEIQTARGDSLLGYGEIKFNGRGKMTSNSFTPIFQPSSTSNPPKFVVKWTNGADPNEISFDFEDDDPTAPIELQKGIRQVDGEYVVNKFIQNGLTVSSPSAIEISADGTITANIDGVLKDVYQIQLASFVNPNGLKLEGYNTYSPSKAAGNYTVGNPAKSSIGKIVSSSLEKSNVEMVSELSQMIVSQRAYQANAKVVQVANQAMEELNKIMG